MYEVEVWCVWEGVHAWGREMYNIGYSERHSIYILILCYNFRDLLTVQREYNST